MARKPDFVRKKKEGWNSPFSSLDWERESAGPSGNLLPEVLDLGNTADNLGSEILELVGLRGKLALDILADLDGVVNIANDALEILRTKATAGHGWGSNTDTAWRQGRPVSGDGVLVASDVDVLENSLDASTVKLLVSQVDEHHVAVGSVRNKLVSETLEFLLAGLGVLDDLLLVFLELRGSCLLEGDGESGNGVVVGTALVAGEDGEVDGAFQVVLDFLSGLGVDTPHALSGEDHGTSGATERLVSGGGDNVSILEGRWNDTSSDQARNMGHVDNQISTDRIGNLAHSLVVNETAVSRSSGNEDLGAVKLSIGGKGVVVDDASLEVDLVGEGLEIGGDS